MKDASFNQTKIKVKWPSGKKRMQKKRCNFKGTGRLDTQGTLNSKDDNLEEDVDKKNISIFCKNFANGT